MSGAHVLSGDDPQNIKDAAAILRQGGLVAFPTETVYGLGADAFNEKAVCRIFEVKKRPSFDPLIVHIAEASDAKELWGQVPALAKKLMDRFWPGPLTLVLPKTTKVPDVVTAGLETVAVRMPKNKIALDLIRELGRPIAAPSANLFGYTSPTTAQHVAEDFGQSVDRILDGGQTTIGVESTVIKLLKNEAVLLRPGGVSLEELQKIIPIQTGALAADKLGSPGLLDSHYAPWTPFVLMDKSCEDRSKKLTEFAKAYEAEKGKPPRVGFLAFGPAKELPFMESVQNLSESGDLYEAAARLFQAMRKLDKMNLDLILAEPVPERGIGLAVMDRLRKASGGRTLQKF